MSARVTATHGQSVNHTRTTPAAVRRILYYTSFFSAQGGASILFIKLMEALRQGEFQAFAILPESARSEVAKLKNAEAVTEYVYFLPIARLSRRLLNPLRWLPFLWNALRTIQKMRKLMRAKNIDLVHANDMRDFHAPIAAWSCGLPVVWHLRASRSNPMMRLPFAMMLHVFAAKIIASSHRNAAQMLLRRTRARNKATVIYDPGPYRERFHPRVNGLPTRRALGLALEQPVITMIAKYSPRKGHLLFVDAIPLVLARFPQAKFMIVGGVMPGYETYARGLQARAERYVRSGSLILTGERGDAPELIAASDVIVHCSLYDDPFPGVVLEGMAVGRVVIGSAAGGVPEQITHGEDGFLFKMGEARDLADQIIHVLTHPEQMEIVRAAAVKNSERRFSFEKSQKEVAQLYREILRMEVTRSPKPSPLHGRTATKLESPVSIVLKESR